MQAIVAGAAATASARPPWNRKAPALISPNLSRRRSTRMSRGKMKGDDSGHSKRGEARGSGGTTKKSQNAGKQHNEKAQNTKSNRQ
jgi:hypothetical protein